ncbi:hypothetical protein JMJ35_001153 [Cladonia borealis]|uniref:Uncharacterized protein n=1 Tax=Cladonia borealis TaxID=184061 RepID=A0AA39R814_9LECA|nr:hypothetical protein JMJ35_001153 [Cladonia borealis]
MESDIGLRPDVLLDLEREDLNVPNRSATPPGNSPRLGSHPESYSSPNNRTPPWMAMLTSDAALSDLETGPKDSTIPEDQPALTLTTEGSSSAPTREEIHATSFFSSLQDRPSQPQRTESRAPPTFLLGLSDMEDGSDEENGGGNGS